MQRVRVNAAVGVVAGEVEDGGGRPRWRRLRARGGGREEEGKGMGASIADVAVAAATPSSERAERRVVVVVSATPTASPSPPPSLGTRSHSSSEPDDRTRGVVVRTTSSRLTQSHPEAAVLLASEPVGDVGSGGCGCCLHHPFSAARIAYSALHRSRWLSSVVTQVAACARSRARSLAVSRCSMVVPASEARGEEEAEAAAFGRVEAVGGARRARGGVTLAHSYSPISASHAASDEKRVPRRKKGTCVERVHASSSWRRRERGEVREAQFYYFAACAEEQSTRAPRRPSRCSCQ